MFGSSKATTAQADLSEGLTSLLQECFQNIKDPSSSSDKPSEGPQQFLQETGGDTIPLASCPRVSMHVALAFTEKMVSFLASAAVARSN